MRARLIIALAICSSTSVGRARADELAKPSPDALPAPSSTPVALAAAGTTTAAPAEDAAADQAGAPTDPEPRALQAFVHPTAEGLNGGVHVVDARSAAPGTFRVALQTALFRKDGFVEPHDHHRFVGMVLNLNVTPIEHLELAAQLAASSTENRAIERQLIQVVGDARLFAKGYARVLPWLTTGGDLEVDLFNGVGGIGVNGGATSVGLRASSTLDLRALAHSLPLLARANVRYLFDNSGRLVRDIESARYAMLTNPSPRSDEYRNLVTPAERYALQVNRVDRFGMGFGVEVPLVPHPRVHVNPLLEWSFALPVNRQGYDCLSTDLPADRDSCLARKGFAARPSTLSLGARVQPYLPGLGLTVAIDVATSGQRTFVREFAPQARYLVQLGASYAYDARPAAAPRVLRVEVPSGTLRGHVVGQVVESQSGAPIAGGLVHFEGTSLSDVATDTEGSFRSPELAPGAQGMRIRADGYREALCVAVVPTSGDDVAARCELTPNAYYGSVSGRVTDATGQPIARAHVRLLGPAELTASTGPDGSFALERLAEGRYQIEVRAEGFFAGGAPVEVQRKRESHAALLLYSRPAQPSVKLVGKRIQLRHQVQFEPETALLKGESLSGLAEVAEFLQQHPELTAVEVQGHVDDMGDATRAQTLSEQRAQAVRTWLMGAGVAGERLAAKGYGATRPLVPDITLQNRARNRRIDFVVP